MGERLRILFVTRKFPPSVGGMERLSYQLITHLRTRADVRAITWGCSQRLLPWFLFRALLQGLAQARDVDLLHAGDPLVAPVVWLLGRLYHLPTVVNVHGLDLTFNFTGYQAFMPWLLHHFTRVVCISEATYAEALARGLAPERCRIIHPGADLPDQLPDRSLSRAFIASRLDVPLNQKQVWLTVGRLVPRKGVVWFCEQVLPRLRDATDFVYLIVGDGPEAARVREMVARPDLAGRVFWLGRVSDAELHQLYTGADAFIMPNIPQPHDREGFGLVAIEAAMHHLPVIAARLEGIQDAVIEGKTGYLLPPAEALAWADFLRRCLAEPQRLESLRAGAQAAVVERFGWDRMAQRYLDLYREIVQERL
jgi:glycosyltransferase involved in cell wall biosynthesis